MAQIGVEVSGDDPRHGVVRLPPPRLDADTDADTDAAISARSARPPHRPGPGSVRSTIRARVRETPAGAVAFGLGTGTGVLAAVPPRRGVGRVAGTDADPRALVRARDNADRLGLDRQRGDGSRPPSAGPGGSRRPQPSVAARPADVRPRTGRPRRGRAMLREFLRGPAAGLRPAARAGWSSPIWPNTSVCASATGCRI
ncbi:hypothetical protein BM536_030610 [Streptomyces phaeoluteigriseus]|uniref:Methyltransferase small domain-containing protein n=1 Tax=Streptomyces phaeoluteigriseus TaxID=114686 RepID=A0A1V6MJH6_9ACTN|nr:hypothetical protein BM536_030610 [Streptomyces phaeoluteigriseus]